MHNHREAFEEILKLVQSVDVNEDSIQQAMKLRVINEKLRANVRDEKQLSELFEMLNAKALQDGEEFILSLVCAVTSAQCANFTINGKVLRHAMLTQLQKNHQNADNMKKEDLSKLYNSIKLLGEFYNKARLQSGTPISIIGKAMLGLINVELEKELRNICHFNNDEFARTILSQITLNGKMLQNRQKTEIEQVLLTIRKCLIELPSLSAKTKAFLFMIVDLYYSNFMNVGYALERMYQEYLIEDKNGQVTEPIVQNGKLESSEKDKAQKSFERMTISKKQEPLRGPKVTARNLRIKIDNSDTAPVSTRKNASITPQRSSSVTAHKDYSTTQQKIPLRNQSVPRSPQKTQPRNQSVPRSPLQTPQRNQSVPRSPHKTPPRNQSVPRSTLSRQSSTQSTTSPKKLSPQDLRKKTSPPLADCLPPTEIKTETTTEPTEESSKPLTNGNEENILRQQNARSTTPTKACKLKMNGKVYFREENVENLTWNGEASVDIEAEDPDASTSPKVNPYSSSFLNFLSSN